MNNNLSPRKLQAKLTKENIISTAIHLAAEKGLDGFTIRDICESAGTSIGNFYHYFSSKDDVLLQTRQVYDERILLEINKLNTDDVIELLLAIYEARATFVLQRSIEESSVLYILNLKNRSSKNSKTEYKVETYILNVVRKAQEDLKIVSTINPEEFLLIINTVYHGCCYEYIANNGDYDLIKYIKLLLLPVLSSYRTIL